MKKHKLAETKVVTIYGNIFIYEDNFFTVNGFKIYQLYFNFHRQSYLNQRTAVTQEHLEFVDTQKYPFMAEHIQNIL